MFDSPQLIIRNSFPTFAHKSKNKSLSYNILKISGLQRIIFTFLVLAAPLVKAQEMFTSVVVDSASFKPMQYVSVFVKHKGRGTITDEKGSFTVEATRHDTLVFTFVGYSPLTYPLTSWEPGLIRLSENATMLKNITIQTKATNLYEGMFDDQNAIVAARHNKFYYSKAKKEKRKLVWLKEDNQQVKTYVEVVIDNPELKNWLIKEHKISEEKYYAILADFNKKNANVMYYLTAGELVTLIKNFFRLSVRH